MTECGTATYTLPGDDPETVATTIGVPCTDLEVRIVDSSNQPLPAGERGEIVVRGYSVMTGYLGDPEATAATIDSEGWLHTGDLGTCDAKGYFQIVGRMGDMVIVGGFNVYPAEVEEMIRRHPDVDGVAVIGVPDARLGQVVCAYVIARKDTQGNPHVLVPEELIAWCRQNMANFKVPRYVVEIEAFPLTGSNKVSKVDLRERAAADGIGEREVSSAPTAKE